MESHQYQTVDTISAVLCMGRVWVEKGLQKPNRHTTSDDRTKYGRLAATGDWTSELKNQCDGEQCEWQHDSIARAGE